MHRLPRRRFDAYFLAVRADTPSHPTGLLIALLGASRGVLLFPFHLAPE